MRIWTFAIACCLASVGLTQLSFGQTATASKPSDGSWASRRIVMLHTFGDYFVNGPGGEPIRIRANGLGVNVVSVVQRVVGDKVWIKANGAGNEPVGWINRREVILLDDAIGYFSRLIKRDPHDWDAYFRRAEAEHALNQRRSAIEDYSSAVRLNVREPFLYIRRGREYKILKDWSRAAGDFETAGRLRPNWSEPFNLEAGVYLDCPSGSFHDPAKAIDLIQHALALDPHLPLYLTVLAAAYAQSGRPDLAVLWQRAALSRPSFPPGYRQGAEEQLRQYEATLANALAKTPTSRSVKVATRRA